MRATAFVCFSWVCLVATPASAVDAEKLDGATVVQGKVRAIFRDQDANDRDTVTYLYEVVVEKVEGAKHGDELKPGKVLYARAEHLGEKVEIPKYVSPPLAFLMVKLAKGDTVRVYCDRQDDGVYRVRANVSAIKVIESVKRK
jgi:hypothetical protein